MIPPCHLERSRRRSREICSQKLQNNNNHNYNIMNTNEKRIGGGYVSPTLETTSVAAEAGFCASCDATLNGFNDPESVDFDFNN